MSAYGVPFGSYGNAEHPDYYADDPTPDGKCPCDSDMYATGDCPIHDTRPQPPGFCECGSPWCDDPTHKPPTQRHTPPPGARQPVTCTRGRVEQRPPVERRYGGR